MSSPLLRPLGFGEILDGGFTLYRRHFTVLFATALLAMLPMSLATGAWVQILSGVSPDAPSAAGVAAGVLLVAFAGLVSWSVILGALVRQVAGAVSGGEVSIADGGRHALRRFLPIAAAFVLSTAATMVGAFIVAIPLIVVVAVIIAVGAVAGGAPPSGAMPVVAVILIMGTMGMAMLLLMTGFFAVTPAVVLEDRGPIAAIGRSWRLASGARFRIMGILVVSYIIIMLPAVAIMIVGGSGMAFYDSAAAVGPGQVMMQQALSLLSSALTLPFFVACMTLLYFDRRVRTEAYDLEAAADALPVSG